MKYLSLLMWVTQFGLSVLCPLCACLWFCAWLNDKYSIGMWVVLVGGILGLLISISTARSCWRSMRKELDRLYSKDAPVAFNDHV